ncbi:MAG: gliding motility protein GldL [Flavobacteriaceae bacterium]|nr:gliding motility protein GldL [Flavobacteriaceae bacterium]
MAQTRTSKRLFNMAYGLGASVVIMGALFKILHWEINLGILILDGALLLAIGLITEAIIFAISAFEPVEDDLDWALVYPELAGGRPGDKKQKALDAQGMLSIKLDEMLSSAKVDVSLMESLGSGIRSFDAAANGIAPTSEAMNATKRYGEELTLAAAQMESLNSLYKVQLEATGRQNEANHAVADNTDKLKEQLLSLSTNLSSLNGVYGGMLTAMNNNKN